MDSCSIQELIKFDKNKPMASFGKQLLIAMLCVIANNVLFNSIINVLPEEKVDDYHQDIDIEFTSYKQKAVSPLIFGVSEMINGGIYAPIVEELFFRFLLFKIIFIKIFRMNPSGANILQAIVFGLMHMSNVVSSDQQLNKTILQTVSSSIGGLIAGWSYMYTNSLLTPIMSHMINNIIATSSDMMEYSMFYAKQSN